MTEHGITQVLSQGLTVRLIAAPDLPAASACLSTRAGSFHDRNAGPGSLIYWNTCYFKAVRNFRETGG